MTGAPLPTPPLLDEYVAGHLQQRLAEDPRVSEQGIAVRFRAGEIYLTGVVGTAERRETISTVAAEHACGHLVHNEVAVATLVEPTAEERLS